MGATGKTLVGLRVAETLSDVQSVVVLVPSLTLVTQVCMSHFSFYHTKPKLANLRGDFLEFVP